MSKRNDEIVGKSILFGITYRQPNKEVFKQIQLFGLIKSIQDQGHTIEVDTNEDENWYLPLHWPSMMVAPRGEYTLLSAGNKIRNPDFLTSWTVFLFAPGDGSEQWVPNYAPIHNDKVPSEWDLESEYDKEFLKELIDEQGSDYVGKHLLLGLSHYQIDSSGEKKLIKKEQMHGVIARVSYSEGIVIALDSSGQEFTLPPELTRLEPACPEEYVLHSTGETVSNLDYITVWEITQPNKDA